MDKTMHLWNIPYAERRMMKITPSVFKAEFYIKGMKDLFFNFTVVHPYLSIFSGNTFSRAPRS